MLLPAFCLLFSAFCSFSPCTSPPSASVAYSQQPLETRDVFVKTILIPMRDGVMLPADLYLPSPESVGLPCIVSRTPYGRALHPEEHIPLAKEGYAVVVQDMRSSLDLEGKVFPYFTDAWGVLQDGYDTVEWLAKQPFTNGKIATTGISAGGITQNMLAPSAPPHLVCQHIGFAPSSLYEALYQGGVLQKNLVEGWFSRYASNPAVLAFVEAHNTAHAFWSQYDSAAAAQRIDTPALHYGGWYDLFLQGTLKSFTTRHEEGGTGARGQQTLVIGPWTHHYRGRELGPSQWPEQAYNPPVDISVSHWMRMHLKGVKGAQLPRAPAVTYYVMGPLDEHHGAGHVWKQSNSWPVAAESQVWTLHEDMKEDKRTDNAGNENESNEGIVFTFSPDNPVPTIGGRNLFLPSGPLDQCIIEQRDDVLLFTSAPLSEDLEVTGPLEAFLFCQADAPVMDVVVRLMDVYPDGRSLLISEGLTRVNAEKQEQGQETAKAPREVHIDLWATSQVFAKGHCIRVSISASHYPKYSLPSGDTEAHHRLFCGPTTPSRLILPVVKKDIKD